MHQEYVQSEINEIVAVGKEYRMGHPPPSEFVAERFRSMFESLMAFTAEYKKSVHDKEDEPTPSSSVESMDVEPDKKVFVARCTHTGQSKDVPPLHL